MRFKTKILVTLVFIVGFDAVASFLSRILRFEYTKLMWLSFLIYVAIGFWGAFRQGFAYGMLLGTVAGLTDSTLGWIVSRVIGPFLQTPVPSFGPGLVAIVIVIVTASAFALGSLGAALCVLLKQTRNADA